MDSTPNRPRLHIWKNIVELYSAFPQEKLFDKVGSEELLKVLRELDLNENCIRILRNLYALVYE